MTSYLFAVQTREGREVVSTSFDVDKVSTVSAVVDGERVVLRHDGDELASGVDPGGDLRLHRWPADDKLSDPVTHRVRRI